MRQWIRFVIVLTVLSVVYGDDFKDQDDPQDTREMSQIDRENWRALNAFQNDDAWFSQEQPMPQVQKRRRLRKRKRRPTPASFIDDVNSNEEILPPRRSILPHRSEDLEPWKEMAEEAGRKPNVRRRITPTFSEEINEQNEPMIEEITSKYKDDQNINPPDDIINETSKNIYKESETQKASVSNLKEVLKQSGTGSLSEILQQKNLSLSELLMGNRKAINALTETPLSVTEAIVTEGVTESGKYKRLPSISMRKNIDRHFEQKGDSLEELSAKETLEEQRKRLSSLGHKNNKLFHTVTKYDVITEPTTERRIFVPSRPKFAPSLKFDSDKEQSNESFQELTIEKNAFVPSHPKFNIPHSLKPDFDNGNEQANESFQVFKEESITTTTTTTKPTKTTRTHLKPKIKSLPLTNAKINKLTTKIAFKVEETEEENYPMGFEFPKPMKIDIEEVPGYKQQYNERRENNEGPLKMTIDLTIPTVKPTEKEVENYPQPWTSIVHIDTTTEEEIIAEKIIPATAKDEIMEIMKDPISRERLSRILENRNMTVKELVEQRERGSSQLHLADIFHNKTREPEPEGEPFVGTISSEYFNSFPLFDRQPKNMNFEDESSNSQSSNLYASSTLPVNQITEKTTAQSPAIVSTSFPAVKIEVEKTKNQIQPFPRKELGSGIFSRIYESRDKESVIRELDPLIQLPEQPLSSYSEEELQRIDDIQNTFSLHSNKPLNIDSDSPQIEDEVLINLPSGVKSAIFVSLTIICLSIIVFLTILLIFKWVQRQNKKINYCNSLSTKFKSPIIMQKRPTSALKSLMNETLGRNNYYKSSVQSTDHLWEGGRERMPSF